jgi:mono/diheme cytochrome c family protein|tara:strand:- start:5922 stop:6320 length:399 start_codon:yes stop_codon:yes gene_type:complete
MKKRLFIIIFISVVLLISNVGNVIAEDVDIEALKNPRSSDPNSKKNGEMRYMQRCAICHGKKADGKGPSAESFEAQPWNFVGGEIEDVSDGFLFQKIKNGGVWFEMPPFSLILKDDEIWDIVSYLRFVSTSS